MTSHTPELHYADEPTGREKLSHVEHQADFEYLPCLIEITDKRKASWLIERVKSATKSLKSALVLTMEKKGMWSQFKEKFDLPVEGPNANVFDVEKYQKVVEKIAEVYDAENPYLAMQKLLGDPQIKDILLEMGGYRKMDVYITSFYIREKIKGLLAGKRKDVETRRKDAIEIAKTYARDTIWCLTSSIRKYSSEMRTDLVSQRRSIEILISEFSISDALNMESAQQKLMDALKQLKRNIEKAKGMAALIESLKEHRSMRGGDCESQIDAAISELSELMNKISETMNCIAEKLSRPGYGGYLYQEKRRIITDLEGLNADSNVRGTNTDNSYYITREFDDAVCDFNGLLDVVDSEIEYDKKIRGDDKYYYHSYAALSREISSGRVFTHSAPTDLMYLVLEDGVLRSHHEQKKNKGAAKRTHDRMLLFEWSETHDICFEPNKIYRNFQNSKLSSIALIFSENVLLVEGRLFAESDGVHVYDENFRGEGQNVPGLNIDLKTTPCMIMVVNSERDRFLQFLKTQSVWKKELGEMTEQQMVEWLENNVIFVDKLDIDENVQRVFSEKKKPVLKVGYVEITNIRGQMKTRSVPIKKFIPIKEKKI